MQAQHKEGAIESFQVGGKTFNAQYNSKTGEFTKYAFAGADGSIENYNYENYRTNGEELKTAGFLIGTIESNYGLWEQGYDHENYITTAGVLMPIRRPNGQFRSERAESFAHISTSVKLSGLGLSAATNIIGAALVYRQYEQGGFKNINKLDAAATTLGTMGVLVNGLNLLKFSGPVLTGIGKFSGIGGLAISTYQSWSGFYQMFNDLNHAPNSLGDPDSDWGVQQEHNLGLYSESDFYNQ